MTGVGSKIVFEDEKVKVWEFNLEPGEKTSLHTHELDYVFYVIDGANLEVFDADDNDLGTLELSSGQVVPIRVEGDELVVINGAVSVEIHLAEHLRWIRRMHFAFLMVIGVQSSTTQKSRGHKNCELAHSGSFLRWMRTAPAIRSGFGWQPNRDVVGVGTCEPAHRWSE